MAMYAQKGDAARLIHNHSLQLNGLRIQRPRNSHVKTLNFEKEGPITFERFFSPALVTIDPLDSGQVVEHKRIIAVAGWLNEGEVIISYQHNSGYFFENHVITGGFNYQELEEPFIIGNGLYKGEYLRPEIQEEPVGAANLMCMIVIETSPI